MNLVVAPDIVTLYPDLRIGIVTCRGMDNTGKHPEIAAIKQAAVAALRATLSAEELNQHPYITAWRETYRKFGTKPKDHRPTAEALLRRVLRGEDLPTISSAVDLYLAIETEFYLPIGGYDLDHVAGDITLRLSPGAETFVPIGVDKPAETTYAGEVVYADDAKILTRRWNYRDCDVAKVTAASRNIALFSEATLSDIPTQHLTTSMNRLAEYLQRFCGGIVAVQLVAARVQATQEI